jgi:hypothetical protein
MWRMARRLPSSFRKKPARQGEPLARHFETTAIGRGRRAKIAGRAPTRRMPLKPRITQGHLRRHGKEKGKDRVTKSARINVTTPDKTATGKTAATTIDTANGGTALLLRPKSRVSANASQTPILLLQSF